VQGSAKGHDEAVPGVFVVARNPDPESRLPYLLQLPLDGGILLKARETWPRSSRVYCYPLEGSWPEDAEVLEEVAATLCRRRGAAVDLVLDRPRLSRSQFVFTEARGRPAIFWQTQVAARRANPGGRVPKGRTLAGLTVVVDSRERYPYRFAGRSVSTERAALPAGDYGVRCEGGLAAVVERKTLENLASSLSDGTLAFQMQRLSQLPAAAVVVEADFPDLFRQPPGRANWLADVLARLQVRYKEVAVVFAGSRKFAEEWTYRFLRAAASDAASLEEPD
jgi:ERCC4 domain